MSNTKTLILVTAILEAILGIPFVGGLIVISLSYVPLIVMLIVHIITLFLVSKENKPRHGSIAGIITSCIGWIPFVGMVLHIVTAILLFLIYTRQERGYISLR
ncbi:hypothetical protein ACHHV8_18140 [Paenibacillus sp. TAB 01]|uniref:hypothetical protein n=1 Tax=Paenibacillus sp. TAB 01 TaxID=3368988 RepID=UPI00375091EC